MKNYLKKMKKKNKLNLLINENWFIKSKNKILIAKSKENKPKSVKELINYLEDIEEVQIKKEKECYENNPIIRLIYGTQFNTIYKYVKNNINKEDKKSNLEDKDIEEEITFLNKYITNNKIERINIK